MARQTKSIPLNIMTDEQGAGIDIQRLALPQLPPVGLSSLEVDRLAHRHNTHTFHLLEKGTVHLELDFQHYQVETSSLIYIHPDQVHRTTATDSVIVVSLAITNENLNPQYLYLLDELVPARPLPLAVETVTLINQAVSLCLKVAERKSDQLQHAILKDACNALVALILSTYLAQTQPTNTPSRFELVTKAFKHELERHYRTQKRPAYYANKLALSTAYLNECVKNTTGQSVSHHIQQRVILEAKRWLSYSDQSVKEIAARLGYDDYPAFCRLFKKMTGISGLAFRGKNRD